MRTVTGDEQEKNITHHRPAASVDERQRNFISSPAACHLSLFDRRTVI
jgi:hypothetical protein